MALEVTTAEALVVDQQTTAVNAAFLADIKDLNRELWATLEKVKHLCARPISMRSQGHELVDLLTQLTNLLRVEFSLEESFGYFEHAVSVEPRLSRDACRLRGEHSTLLRSMSRLADFAELLWHEGKLASLTTIVPASFDRFYDALSEHEQAERELLSDSLLKEIGIGD